MATITKKFKSASGRYKKIEVWKDGKFVKEVVTDLRKWSATKKAS